MFSNPTTIILSALPARAASTTISDIQESFLTRTFNLEAISNWLWGVAGIAVLIIGFMLFKAIQARRVRYSPFGTIVDNRVIRTILRTAFDQRRPFEVQVQTVAGQRRPTLRCAPEYIGQKSLTLEVSGLKSLSDKWLGRSIAVFFRIQYGKEFTYYTFSSRIDGIHLPRPGVCHISVSVPAVLENRQKRSFLRITPPSEFFLGAAMWHAESMPTHSKLNELTDWPRPKLLHLPDRLVQFHVLDLSAGGARISIPRQVVRAFNLRFTSAEPLVLMLDLFDPEQNKRLRFWMQCRVQSVWIEHATRDMHMGLQFTAWARPREAAEFGESASGIEWLRLSSANEIEALGNWIMRRHLELFRENPVDF